VVLNVHVPKEACPFNLAPTASTTAMLAMGDALAMTLLVAKGFRQEDFLSLHPGGGLGKRLMRAEHVMHSGDLAPIVRADTSMADAIAEMSRKGLGMTCVVDAAGMLVGVITDGDLRRHVAGDANLLARVASDVMTARAATIGRETMATEALRVLEERKITSVVVVDSRQIVQGVVHLHDLWRTEMF
jgi:arabinose-5-phosphate isomerase